MKASIQSVSGAAIAGVISAGLLLGCPLAANANQVVILPDATWSGFVKVPVGFPVVLDTTLVTGPGTIQGGFGNSFAGETSQGTPFPSIDVRAGGVDLAQISGGQAHVELRYSIEIVGPGSGLAPLHITGSGNVDSFSGGIGNVRFEVLSPAIAFVVRVASQNGIVTVADGDGVHPVLPDYSSFTIDGTELFPVNTVLSVEMYAGADSHINRGPSEGSAFIDPVFSIDPSIANAGQYSIVTSEGIGNGHNGGGGGVPEPASWTLMLTGFGALGATLRDRRRNLSNVA